MMTTDRLREIALVMRGAGSEDPAALKKIGCELLDEIGELYSWELVNGFIEARK